MTSFYFVDLEQEKMCRKEGGGEGGSITGIPVILRAAQSLEQGPGGTEPTVSKLIVLET